ncbi:MAG TPA: ADYC domain-containing protein, partial [Kofleriaceae bacterium]
PLDGMENQGTHLLGALLDPLGNEPGYHPNVISSAVTADGQAVTVQFDGSAALRSGDHRGADPFFNGMILTGSEGAKVRLTVSRGGYDVAFYKLEGLGPTGWANLCDHDGDDAVPLAGKWQRSGFHETAPDRISFACTGAVAYKCLVWGYLAGSDSTSLGWRAHQACTRMARGDYCANGHSHTREGTTITIYDFAGVTSPPPLHFDGVVDWAPNPNRMFFEAAWSDGAHPASCLSRLRWQSLPLGPLCDDGDLRDPRLDTGVRFCEDIAWPPPGSEPTGALLFNASRYTDMALHVWQRGDDMVSTVQGFYQLPNVIQPFPSVGPYEHIRNDGSVLRSLRSDQDRASYEDLWLYRNGSDFVVAGASRPPPGFTPGSFEGFAAKQQSPGMLPFNLYIHQDTGDTLSTTGTPDAAYVLQWTIGYVAPPETR